MRAEISPSGVSGELYAPPSKAVSHRAIICASLSEGKTSIIRNALESEDIKATIRACTGFGAQIRWKESGKGGETGLTITGSKVNASEKEIDCGESGSTIRFMAPVFALASGKTILIGKGTLAERPMEPVIDALNKLGGKCSSNDGKQPLEISGPIKGGRVAIDGKVSSQFISGLIFALPLAEEDSEIWVKGNLESLPYIDLTLEAVREFGIKVTMSDDYKRFRIPGTQKYKGLKGYGIEGDYSSAAFLLAAGAIGGSMELHGLKKDSKQGDSIIVRILKSMGADVRIGRESVKVVRENLYGIELDARNIPDLVPILAVLGCYAKGKTRIFSAGRLRMKESDRLASITSELRKMGAEIDEKQDELIISGSKLTGAVVDAHKDHRIAMSCAIAALGAKGKTAIEGAECVSKSYPNFFSDLSKITQKKK